MILVLIIIIVGSIETISEIAEEKDPKIVTVIVNFGGRVTSIGLFSITIITGAFGGYIVVMVGLDDPFLVVRGSCKHSPRVGIGHSDTNFKRNKDSIMKENITIFIPTKESRIKKEYVVLSRVDERRIVDVVVDKIPLEDVQVQVDVVDPIDEDFQPRSEDGGTSVVVIEMVIVDFGDVHP